MDERTLNELLECSVCLDRLDASSKVLPCQHTFCRRCLEEIVSTKHELRCPECRSLVQIPIEDLPSNILLIRLLEGLKTVATGVSPVLVATRAGHKVSIAAASNVSQVKLNVSVGYWRALMSFICIALCTCIYISQFVIYR